MTVGSCPSGFTEYTAAAGYYIIPVVTGRTPGNTYGVTVTAATEDFGFPISYSAIAYGGGVFNTNFLTDAGGPPAGAYTRGAFAPGFYMRLCQKN